MLFRENNICATVPSLVIDDHFSPFVLARFQVETFNKSGGSRKSDLIQIQFLTNHTTDALDRDLEKHVWFHGTHSMFTIDNCQTLSDWAISREERPRPRVHQSRILRQRLYISNQKWTPDVPSHISVLRRWHGQKSQEYVEIQRNMKGKCGTTKKYKRRSALINPPIVEGWKCCQMRQ